jgi:uncharacterized protein YecA (UPF0149 family)
MIEKTLDDGTIEREVIARRVVTERYAAVLARLNDIFHDKGVREVRVIKDIGRNQPCPCGSGHKFKKCCLLTAQRA